MNDLSNEPEYDHTLVVRNGGPEPRTVDVRITHVGTAEIVYSASPSVDSDEEIDIFDFSEIEDTYGGVESFTIRAETDHHSGSATFATSQCHGIPIIIVGGDGIDVTYAIC